MLKLTMEHICKEILNDEDKHNKYIEQNFGFGIFSKDEVNTGRQIELDIAKGFAILFMI